MTSVNIILRTGKTNAQGKHPLAIQIIKDRRPSIMHLGHFISESEWDEAAKQVKKSNPNHARLNNLIRKKLAEATDKALELTTTKDDVSSKAIKNKIKPKVGVTFFPQAQLYLDTLEKGGKFNRHSADKPRIERFREFLDGGDVSFSDITVTMLERFKAYLKGTRQISDRTIINHLVVIRSIFSQAIKDEVIDGKTYPFGKNKIKIKFPDSKKTGLNADEIKALEDVATLNKYEHHARNLWLLSYYNAGMRVSDVFLLNWNDIQDGRLWYRMGKNNKGDSIKLHQKAVTILEQYRENNPVHNLVFPDLKGLPSLDDKFAVQKRIKARVHETNDQLKSVAEKAKINKNLTMHLSRHSFAQSASDKIPLQVLQRLYRHTSIVTTAGYQSNFTSKDSDNALDAVLDG